MPQEVKDILLNVLYNAPTTFAAWLAGINWATTIAIVLGLLQVCYLIRKWIREETEWGMRMKRWGAGMFTKPGDL